MQQVNPNFLSHALLDSDDENEIDTKSHYCIKYENHIYCIFLLLITVIVVLFVVTNT
uniref:Uncharacterized protein n=1 Tax=viral metagenome TaxID=1070528 RepID=A0A6C0C183_9ZZZZ